MVAAAVWTSRALLASPYDLALNAGVCGAFDRSIPLASVVHVTSDCLPELGAEDDEAFLPVEALGLQGAGEFPFSGGRLVNRTPPANPALGALPEVAGITVNTVHGRRRSIDSVVARLAPQVESMEGAAFMYACLVHGAAFAQVRAVSNFVERRNRGAWKMEEAVEALGAAVLRILDHA